MIEGKHLDIIANCFSHHGNNESTLGECIVVKNQCRLFILVRQTNSVQICMS